MHYHELMGHSISVLKEQMKKKQEKVLIYGSIKKYNEIIDSTEPKELLLIKIIMKHFKEDFHTLFKTYPVRLKFKAFEYIYYFLLIYYMI